MLMFNLAQSVQPVAHAVSNQHEVTQKCCSKYIRYTAFGLYTELNLVHIMFICNPLIYIFQFAEKRVSMKGQEA